MKAAPQNDAEVRSFTRAHVVPFFVFMAFLLLLQFAGSWISWKHPDAPWWRRAPEQWLYPVQALVTFAFVLRYRNYYDFRWSWRASFGGVIFGMVGIGIWLLPTTIYDHLDLTKDPGGWMGFLGVASRTDGFDPVIFESPVAWWSAVILRFFRAAVVVAFS